MPVATTNGIKKVMVSGASSGIGAACARLLAKQGFSLVLVARQLARLQNLRDELLKDSDQVDCLQLDVRDRKQVTHLFKEQRQLFSQVDALINNAGLARGLETLDAGNIDDWEEMIDTNVKGLLYLTRQMLPLLKDKGFGHIINIGSIAGHEVYANGVVYCATKHAVAAITDGLRLDLNGHNIRCTSIDPGMVETEFSEVRFHGDTQRAKAVYQGVRPLRAEDVAEAVVWSLSQPHHVNIQSMLIMPTDQASATTINRQ